MTEQAKILRVFKLIQYLKAHRRKAEELAGLFDVNKRTIYRYFHLLEDIGFIVDKDMDDRYFIATYDEEKEGVQFGADEAELVKQVLETGATNHPLIDGILKKLYVNSELNTLSEDVINARKSQLIRKLHLAIEHENRVVLSKYHSPSSNTIRDRLVEPINISDDYETLVAFDPESEDTKTFKIDRIAEVIEMDQGMKFTEKFKEPKKDIFGMTGDKKSHIKLKLSMRAQLLLREEFPLSVPYISQITDSENEYIFEHYVHHYSGVGRFVLGLIDQLEVLETDEFKTYLNQRIGFKKFKRSS